MASFSIQPQTNSSFFLLLFAILFLLSFSSSSSSSSSFVLATEDSSFPGSDFSSSSSSPNYEFSSTSSSSTSFSDPPSSDSFDSSYSHSGSGSSNEDEANSTLTIPDSGGGDDNDIEDHGSGFAEEQNHKADHCAVLDWKITQSKPPLSGAPNFRMADIKRRLGILTSVVDPSVYHFSCVDGRFTKGVLGTPGGDLGEFLLAMNVYLKSGGHLHDLERVLEVYNKYLNDLSVFPLEFYMHTDSHAIERIKEELGEDFDITSVPKDKQDEALEVLLKPENVGCGHLRLMLQYPEEYETDRELTEMFLRAFFNYMWNFEDPKARVHITDLEILDGTHIEKATLQVWEATSDDPEYVASPPECVHMAPLVAPSFHNESLFIHHPDAVKYIRRNFAEFFATEVGPENSTEVLWQEANRIGDNHVALTLGHLAPKLALYSAKVTHMRDRVVSGRRMLLFLLVVSIGGTLSVYFLYFYLKRRIGGGKEKEMTPISSSSSGNSTGSDV